MISANLRDDELLCQRDRITLRPRRVVRLMFRWGYGLNGESRISRLSQVAQIPPNLDNPDAHMGGCCRLSAEAYREARLMVEAASGRQAPPLTRKAQLDVKERC